MTTVDRDSVVTGEARCPAPSVQEYLERDTRAVPEALRRESYVYLGSEDLPKYHYTSRPFHELEVERMWSRVWQIACREEELARPGDTLVYDLADSSVLLVRTDAGLIKAYYNSCLHRGTALRSVDGNVRELRCPFHGFAWTLNGELSEIPEEWDFGHIDRERFVLPELRTATWAGFVFVNHDPEAESLSEYLEDLPDHFVAWPLEERYTGTHVTKVMNANWKVTLEAFLESFHTPFTHPQLVALGDVNTEYDIYPDRRHYSRAITPNGVPSPVAVNLDERGTYEAYFGIRAKSVGGDHLELPDGLTAREFLADVLRHRLSDRTGVDLSHISDSEALDAIMYFVFPNVIIWPGYALPNVFRFRPNGNDVDSSIMDVLQLWPYPHDLPRPEPATTHTLGADEPWSSADELGSLGPVLDQDTANMPKLQKGLKAGGKPGITLGNYQEGRIRHFHRTLDSYLAESRIERRDGA
jgi:phenylpropionate dioxygenase-like ring-hydroxylating dioxygenase large terminal subunit